MHEDFMDNGTRERRARVLLGVVVVLFGILSVRLYLLQISDWEHYRIQSEMNTMQPVPIEANRGLIRDRNGVVLVDNRPSYTISIVPPRLPNRAVRKRVVERLSRVIGLPDSFIFKKLSMHKRHYYEPVKLKRDGGFGTVSTIEEGRYDLPGVEIQVEARRGYPILDGTFPLAPHVLGYVGLIDADSYSQMRPQGYNYDDQVGKRGVERLCESELRGQDGVKYIEVNARGREVGSFPSKTEPAVPGKDVTLTLDWRLQRVAERAFGDSLQGSLIAMDPRNGEILAMLSKPEFHPQSLRNPREWAALQSDPANPLLNRSLQGEYPPGSVLKMVTAIAGLEMGLVTPNEVPQRYVPCTGEFPFGDRIFHGHGEHGRLSLHQALVVSCDIFFYQLGRDVGIANWSRYARMLGLGQPTGIDLANGGDGEAEGLIPTRQYYMEKRGRWSEGLMLNLAIGQGETLVTPIQVARYVSAIATGALTRPHVLKNAGPEPPPIPLQISAQTLKAVRSMMVDVVESSQGTGRLARVEGVEVAGKTGTAQNSHGNDHAWFVAFAPAQHPRITVVVLAENAGYGGQVAAPIAQKVLAAYFHTLLPEQNMTVADRGASGKSHEDPPPSASPASSPPSTDTPVQFTSR